ncbi:MlaD family protein [Candidatus Skiveiella danica]|jgi:phospholipid/cholesterol/gamma-HCH transport system substrate-binding protein|uniref:MlaD family protein n=1 Tax=Candidatus Skiveiella danica TaxID=3386177 RepID=UPI0039B9AB79
MSVDPAASQPRLEFRAAMLVVAVLLLIAASVGYLLYARGVFERTQTLVLIADDSEGVAVGMDMTFSGFALGRVSQIALAPDGNARIVVQVPRKDAHWLRTSSVFTMERGMVGGTRIRAYSGILTDPPLPDGAERVLLRGDATAEIPRLMNAVRELLANLQVMTAADSPLNASLANVGNVTAQLRGPRGALGLLMGNEADARKLITTLDRTNALLARFDDLAAKADTQVFGEQGVMPATRATVAQLNGLLADARLSLKKVDAVLLEAQAVAANAREGTSDLAALRAEVDASLRKVEHLVNEINRKWPFARDPEIKLP